MNRVGILVMTAMVLSGCVLTDGMAVSPALQERMKASLDAGKAAVIARDGKIVAELEGRGVKPLLDALAADPKAFEGVVAMDKVIGRAAAAIYIVGKADTVIAPVMSVGAKELLERHGVKAVTENPVPYIINRRRDGMCPMDKATMDLENPEEIVGKLCRIQSDIAK